MSDTGSSETYDGGSSGGVADAPLDATSVDAATVDAASSDAAWSGLAGALWAEREGLEVLLYQLIAQRQVAETGQARWFRLADAQVRVALENLQYQEISRAAETDAVITALRVTPEVPLRVLVERAPEPWSMILDDHRQALLTLWAEIERTATDNRVALAAVAAAREDSA